MQFAKENASSAVMTKGTALVALCNGQGGGMLSRLSGLSKAFFSEHHAHAHPSEFRPLVPTSA